MKKDEEIKKMRIKQSMTDVEKKIILVRNLKFFLRKQNVLKNTNTIRSRHFETRNA
jgi:hypothetical protein